MKSGVASLLQAEIQRRRRQWHGDAGSQNPPFGE